MVINKNRLLDEVQIFLDDLEKSKPENKSLEWYLINHLKEYLIAINFATTANKIKQETDRLDMFCIDSMNWDTDLFKRCNKITELGLKVAKSS